MELLHMTKETATKLRSVHNPAVCYWYRVVTRQSMTCLSQYG